MRILAYDTSSDALTIAVYEDGKKLAELESHSFARHSSVLMPNIEKLLKDSRIKLDSIDVLAVGLGPGSFTGLRVGVAAAKVFAYIKKIKLIGISSLEVMAWEADGFDGEIAVIMDARKEKLYAGIYRIKSGEIKTIQKPQLLEIGALLKNIKHPRLFIGNGVKINGEKILNTKHCRVGDNAESVYPRATYIAKQAFQLAKKKKFLDPSRMQPMYLHPKDCNVTKK